MKGIVRDVNSHEGAKSMNSSLVTKDIKLEEKTIQVMNS